MSAADQTQRAQDIASALTDAVDSALRSAASGLETQIRRRAEDAADGKEANRACYRLLLHLQERHQARAQRFEAFALTYLLSAPEGPAIAPLTVPGAPPDGTLEARRAKDDITGLAVPDAWKSKESQVLLEQEISKVQEQLLQSMRKSHALHQESIQLKQRLNLVQAAEEATGCGLRQLAKDLREVVQQVGQLTGKDRGYVAQMHQASPQKRRSFLEDVEGDELGAEARNGKCAAWCRTGLFEHDGMTCLQWQR